MKPIRAIVALSLASTCLTAAAQAQCCNSSKDMSETLTSFAPKAAPMDIIDTAVKAGSFNTLAAALTAAKLIGPLKGDGPFTVFAPTDAAFEKLAPGTVEHLLKPENRKQLTAILTYHVVSGSVMAKDVVKLDNATTLNGQRVDIRTKGGGVMIDNANVVKADIKCTNGVIHVIDRVILPSTDTIVDIAASNGSFNTLVAAVKAAGLAETLMGEGPFTVFAPTDAAFAKLAPGTVESLLRPENIDQLKAILTYHVVPGRVYLRDAVAKGRLKTVQGDTIRIPLDGGRIRIDDAELSTTDLEASNGVIHVIDRVILPGS